MSGGSLRRADLPARGADTVGPSQVALSRLLVLVLASVALGVALVASTAAPPRHVQPAPTTQPDTVTRQSQTLSTPSTTTTRPPLERAAAQRARTRWGEVVFTILGVTVSLGMLLLALALLVLLTVGLVLVFTRLGAAVRVRIGRQEVATLTPMPEEEAQPVDAVAVAPRLRELGRGSVREEVVACWADLEDAARAAGLARFEHETSTEFADRLRMSRPVDAVALRRLLELFREARFSEHELPEAARSQATEAVMRLRRDLGVAAVVTTEGGRE